MNALGVSILTTANFRVWLENVKSQLLVCGSNIWKMVREGCGKGSVSPKVMHQNVQVYI